MGLLLPIFGCDMIATCFTELQGLLIHDRSQLRRNRRPVASSSPSKGWLQPCTWHVQLLKLTNIQNKCWVSVWSLSPRYNSSDVSTKHKRGCGRDQVYLSSASSKNHEIMSFSKMTGFLKSPLWQDPTWFLISFTFLHLPRLPRGCPAKRLPCSSASNTVSCDTERPAIWRFRNHCNVVNPFHSSNANHSCSLCTFYLIIWISNPHLSDSVTTATCSKGILLKIQLLGTAIDWPISYPQEVIACGLQRWNKQEQNKCKLIFAEQSEPLLFIIHQ